MTATTMTKDGTVTLPADIRRDLTTEAGATFVVEVDPVQHTIVLYAAVDAEEDDSWAYTPEHIALVQKALASPVSYRLSESDRMRIGGLTPADVSQE